MQEENKPVYQAIGVIPAQVIEEEGKTYALIELSKYNLTTRKKDKTTYRYSLFYSQGRRKVMINLKRVLTRDPQRKFLLAVYPQVIHPMQRDESHIIGFQLVGYCPSVEERTGLASQLSDFEFKINGDWQFIPTCRVPVLSVKRNFTDDAYKSFKEQKEKGNEIAIKRMTKVNHVPFIWRDSTVGPFRFNPRTKEQKDTYFVQAIARFLPDKNKFGCTRLIDEPTTNRPKSLNKPKAKKKQVAKAS